MVGRRTSNSFVPLNEAVWKFSPRSLIDEFDRVRSVPAPKPPTTVSDDQAENWKIASSYLMETFQQLADKNEPIEQMREYILAQLAKNKLEARGVQIAPEVGKERENIPSFMFRDLPKINWSRNSIKNLGREFGAVEVRRPNRESAHSREVRAIQKDTAVGAKSSRPTLPSPAPLGRPSVGAELLAVIQELVAEGKLKDRSRKEQEDVVRLRARNAYPNLFPTPSRPSRTKILQALKKAGL